MANLYTVGAIGALFGPFKNMISIYNGTGSGKILKVYDIQILNNQTVAVTGVISSMELWRITSISGGGALTATKHNSDIATLPAQIVMAIGASTTRTSLFRRLLWSTDEPAAISSTVDEIQILPSFNNFWETPFSTNLEALVLNEGEGITVYFNTNSSVGQADFLINFTAD